MPVGSRAKLYWNWIRNLGTFPQMRATLCSRRSSDVPSTSLVVTVILDEEGKMGIEGES